MKAIIKKLVEAYGPSGHEEQVRKIIKDELTGLADDIRTDTLGNLIVYKKGTGKGRKVMLSAHMDEIGVIVAYIDRKGFLRINPIGGVNPLYVVAGRVRFADGTIGVIGMEKLDDNKKIPQFDKLFVDVGGTDGKAAPVKVGAAACFDRGMEERGDSLIAKAMDDRIGCAVLIGVLRALKKSPHDLYFVFSVQEEVGLRGAITGAYGIEPELGIAVDVTACPDTPEPPYKMAIELGKGPAVKIKDGGMLASPRVKKMMIETAEKNRIPYQLEVLGFGATDARAIQTSQSGVESGCLSIPCRYLHSPSETVSLRDVNNAVKLLTALLKT